MQVYKKKLIYDIDKSHIDAHQHASTGINQFIPARESRPDGNIKQCETEIEGITVRGSLRHDSFECTDIEAEVILAQLFDDCVALQF